MTKQDLIEILATLYEQCMTSDDPEVTCVAAIMSVTKLSLSAGDIWNLMQGTTAYGHGLTQRIEKFLAERSP